MGFEFNARTFRQQNYFTSPLRNAVCSFRAAGEMVLALGSAGVFSEQNVEGLVLS